MKYIFFYILLSPFSILHSPSAQAAVLYIIPQAQTVSKGDTFLAEVRMNTEGERISKVSFGLEFPQELLEVVDVSDGGSIASLVDGFSWELQDDFEGDGLISRIIFLAKEIGRAKLEPRSPSQLTFLNANYEIVEKQTNIPVVSSPTHPNQNQWYTGTTLRIQWNFVEGAPYSFLLSRDPLFIVDDISDQPSGQLAWFGDMEYAWLEDGIYYFHLKECSKQFQGAKTCAWGGQASYRVMIDTIAPEEFQPEVAEMEGKKYAIFSARDMMSGIDHYEVAEIARKKLFGMAWGQGTGPEVFKKAQSPFLLEDQEFQSIIRVKAIDKAGNARIGEIVPAAKVPLSALVAFLILIVIVAVIVFKSLGRTYVF